MRIVKNGYEYQLLDNCDNIICKSINKIDFKIKIISNKFKNDIVNYHEFYN